MNIVDFCVSSEYRREYLRYNRKEEIAMSNNVNKKRLLAGGLFILIIIAVVCAVVLGRGAKKLTYDEAKAKLLELMADHPDIDKMDIWDEDINPCTDVIEIFDGKDFRTESVYNFTFRFNENMPGLEERLAGDYAISLDGEHIYYYDQVNDYHVEYKIK